MDVVHANGQSAEGKLGRVSLKIHSRGRTRGEHGRSFRHKELRESRIQVNKRSRREQGCESNPLTADRTFSESVGMPRVSAVRTSRTGLHDLSRLGFYFDSGSKSRP